MSRATLRVRLGVIAATVITGLAISVTPAFVGVAGASSSSANTGFQAADPGPMTLDATPSKPAKKKHHETAGQKRQKKVKKVIREAKRQKGKPYVYGADGPNAFDCSGLVRFVFLHSVHRSLPHNAAEQYQRLHHIKKSQLKKGDLVFVDNGGYVSHVGIFDGHHHWWVAPESGTVVQRQRIYHAHFVYARVLRFHHH
jgi:cell wall-associated NlpC family hydrolase